MNPGGTGACDKRVDSGRARDARKDSRVSSQEADGHPQWGPIMLSEGSHNRQRKDRKCRYLRKRVESGSARDAKRTRECPHKKRMDTLSGVQSC